MISIVLSFIRSYATMLQRHRVAHAVLAGIYTATTIILAVEAAYAHAVCAAVAAVVYGAMCQPHDGPGPGRQGAQHKNSNRPS